MDIEIRDGLAARFCEDTFARRAALELFNIEPKSPAIKEQGVTWRKSGDNVEFHFDSVLNAGDGASGALKCVMSLIKEGRTTQIAEVIIATNGLDAGEFLSDFCVTAKIPGSVRSGLYKLQLEIAEFVISDRKMGAEWWVHPGLQLKFNGTLNWKDRETEMAEAEERRKRENCIVTKDDLAAQSYKPVEIGFEGLDWKMSDGEVTIHAKKISNKSTWRAGALNLTLWYCRKPYQSGQSDNEKYEMADGIVSPNALSWELGKDFFENPTVTGKIKCDPPTGDYYALVVIYEKQAEGGWKWRAETSWDNPHHWENQAEARKRAEEERERMLSHREKTLYDFPPADVRQRIFDAIAEAREEAAKKQPAAPKLGMDALFAGTPLWSGDATDGFSFPIGVQEDGSPLVMEIGDANVHGLVGGMTGSGKSNLLHAIIHSLCWKYSPAELELHLLDYKDGMEFKVYSNEDESQVWLPHAKTISTHNDPAYALSLFDELQRETMRRKRVFGSARSYREFRQKGGGLPRIFVLVDEFHKLFEGPEANDVAERVMQVLKQGRSYGIHLLMSTQALRGIDADLTAMKGQISARLALRGNEDDGILDVDNDAAAHIERPMCIYNDRTGQTAGNHFFKVPFVDVFSDAEAAFHDAIEKTARKRKFMCNGRIFRGTELPRRPVEGELLSGAPDDTTGFAVRIGVRDDYLAQPAFVALDDAPNGHFLAAAPNGNDALDDAGNLTCNAVWDGLRDSVLASLAATPETEVLLYDPLGRVAPKSLPKSWSFLGAGTGEEMLLEALRTLSQSSSSHRVLVVENWAKAVKLHPRAMSDPFGAPEETAGTVFASAFSSANDTLPFHVVLFVRNFTYARRETFGGYDAGCDILKGCSQRVAVNLAENDLGELFPTMSMKGSAHRILVGNTESDEVFRFLPFRAD